MYDKYIIQKLVIPAINHAQGMIAEEKTVKISESKDSKSGSSEVTEISESKDLKSQCLETSDSKGFCGGACNIL